MTGVNVLLRGYRKIELVSRQYKHLKGLRFASTKLSSLTDNPFKLKFLSDEDTQATASYYPKIVRDVLDKKLVSDIPEVNQRIERLMNSNVRKGKMLRSQLLIATYKYICETSGTPENMNLAYILAWCTEIMNTSILILDDIMDNSPIRRGRKAWYKEVGMMAIADAFILDSVYYALLKSHFGNHKNYYKLIEICLETTKVTYIGQMLDSKITSLDELPVEKFNYISDCKTGFYTFTCPILLASAFADCDKLKMNQARHVLNELGRLYQIQNDFADCFGSSFTGRVGVDIADGRCTWLIMLALQHASASQRKILEEHYGSPNTDNVKKVKRVYEELNIEDQYYQIEKEWYQKICNEVDSISDNFTKNFIQKFVAVFFKKIDSF